jgi:hypothetical protein
MFDCMGVLSFLSYDGTQKRMSYEIQLTNDQECAVVNIMEVQKYQKITKDDIIPN